MIVFPMAGLSSRFFKAGYSEPKYKLPGHGKPLFDHAVESFEHYFDTHPFLFVCRSDYDTEAFIAQRCQTLGIKQWQTVVLNQTTRGQAETVALGVRKAKVLCGPLTIFNIDTFRLNYRFPDFIDEVDGYLEVFKGTGDNWSYAKPAAQDSLRVIETTEKVPISDLCSTGLYHFANVGQFLMAFDRAAKQPEESLVNKELYVAPLYNILISRELVINYQLAKRSDIIFCGVPSEYDEFLANKNTG